MKRKAPFFIATALTSALTASYAFAAGDACLPINRIVSTRVIDRSAIVVTTLDKKRYTVHMRGACIGLDETAQKLSFRTKTELGCLSLGDSVSYDRPGESTRVSIRGSLQTPCFVESVTEEAPAEGR
jgi:hypothetical protein